MDKMFSSQKMNNFLDFFIPEESKKDNNLYKRHRFFILSTVTTFILSFLYVAFFHFIEFQPGVYIVWGYIIFHMLFFIMSHYGVSLFIIGNIFASMTYFGFSYAAATSGGVSSAVVAWHLATKVSSFWYSGKKSGYFWSALTIATITALFIMEGMGHQFPTLYKEEYKFLFSGTMHVGVLIYYVVVLKVYEGWKDKSIEDLEKTILEKDRIVKVVAHDLNNPLTIMSLKISRLLKKNTDEKESEDLRPELLNLSKEIKRIIRISEHILPQENNGGKSFNMSEVIQSLIEDRIQVMADNKSIQINLTISDKKIELNRNVTLFERLLDNILSNAIKYSPTKTSIEIRIEKSTEQINLIIVDEGLGFNEQEIKNAFLEHAGIQNAPTHGESSHGIGLSIVKDLVKQLDATILLTSEGKDKGSCFQISFSI